MKTFKKIIAFLTSFAIVVSLSVVPSFATQTSLPGGTFWDFCAFNSSDVPVIGSFLQYFGSVVSDSVCSTSPDSLHHGEVTHIQSRSISDSVYVADCVCDYCGETFSTTVTDTQFSTAYDEYVSDLPASGYTSDGKIIWYPKVVPGTAFGVSCLFVIHDGYQQWGFYVDLDGNVVSSQNVNGVGSFARYPDHFDLFCQHNIQVTSGNTQAYVQLEYQDACPITGTYQLVVPFPSYFKYQKDATTEFQDVQGGADGFTGSTAVYAAGYNFSYSHRGLIYYNSYHNLVKVQGFDVHYPLAYCVITPSASVSETYTQNSRVGSITGTYMYEGDGGTQVIAENVNFFDESTNTFTNPQTDETTAISSWTYDYATRTYQLYDADGNLVTVAYADSGVTVQEGDTIYNYYYAVPDDSGGGGSDPAHTHNWDNGTITSPASCLMPGVITFTCVDSGGRSGDPDYTAGCGMTRTESIPALGHAWEIKQHVATQYDNTGQLTTAGYVIYECSRCQEQYRSDSGVVPPSGEDNTEITLDKPSFLLWLWAAVKNVLVKLFDGIGAILDFFIGYGGSQNSLDFYNSPSTFSGHSVWS